MTTQLRTSLRRAERRRVEQAGPAIRRESTASSQRSIGLETSPSRWMTRTRAETYRMFMETARLPVEAGGECRNQALSWPAPSEILVVALGATAALSTAEGPTTATQIMIAFRAIPRERLFAVPVTPLLVIRIRLHCHQIYPLLTKTGTARRIGLVAECRCWEGTRWAV
jgi:hypothetical protein